MKAEKRRATKYHRFIISFFVSVVLGAPGLAAADLPIQFGHIIVGSGFRPIENERGFVEPIVTVGPPSYYGPDAGVVALMTYSTPDPVIAMARFEEWWYEWSGPHHTRHTLEHLPYVVAETGRHTAADGSIWEAGSFELVDGDNSPNWTYQAFSAPFPGTPRLFFSVERIYKYQPPPTVARARSVSSTGFEVGLFRMEAQMGSGYRFWPIPRRVNYLAVYSPTGSGSVEIDGESVPYELAQAEVTHQWATVAGMQIKVQEETSKDEETYHQPETIDVLRLDNVILAQDVSARGYDSISLRWRSSWPKPVIPDEPDPDDDDSCD